MTDLMDHERALLLVLGEGDRPADAFLALLDHPDVVAYALPAPWAFERAGVDLLEAMPDLETLTRENLPEALDTLVRLHDAPTLEAVVRKTWLEAEEQVRAFFLQRSVLSTFAGIFRFGPRTREVPPPPVFVEEQIYIHKCELVYRIRRGPEPRPIVAPPEEGSLVFYPFDVANAAVRRDVGLGEGNAPVLEAYAFAPARDQHRRILEEVAAGKGWRVVDPDDG